MRLISIEVTAFNILKNRCLIRLDEPMSTDLYYEWIHTPQYREALEQAKRIHARAREMRTLAKENYRED